MPLQCDTVNLMPERHGANMDLVVQEEQGSAEYAKSQEVWLAENQMDWDVGKTGRHEEERGDETELERRLWSCGYNHESLL